MRNRWNIRTNQLLKYGIIKIKENKLRNQIIIRDSYQRERKERI